MNISPVFSFANQAGLDMLETTLVALQDIMLDKVLDEAGRKILLSEFLKITQQGFAYLPPGICVSSMGRYTFIDHRTSLSNKDVTEAIQKVDVFYDCKIVEGVLGHQLKQFVIDGNKVVLSVSNPDTRVVLSF